MGYVQVVVFFPGRIWRPFGNLIGAIRRFLTLRLECTNKFQFPVFFVFVFCFCFCFVFYHNHYKKGNLGSGGIRIQASEETCTLNQRLRLLGRATGHEAVNICKCNDFAPKHKVKLLQLILVQ